jgi:hypothetical protein
MTEHKDLAKKTTIALLVVMFIIGCVGAFVSTFKMEEYVSFLKAYAPLYISLIASIGVNSFKKKDKEQ